MDNREHPPAAAEVAALRQALARRDEQLARTAHELRTPLCSVVTALEMLRDGYATTAAERDEFLDQAAVAARHLAFLVDDVLDAAALRNGALRVAAAPHRVADLLAEAEGVMGLQARVRGVPLRFAAADPDLLVHTDERRFLQVVFNLVGNALKFSLAGEPVTVSAEPCGEDVRFTVADRGPGVPQALCGRLFEAFAGGAAAGRAAPGTGLGLWVCRQLVERLGGRIGHQPAPERGSRFWFELPRAVRTATPQAVVASPAAPPR